MDARTRKDDAVEQRLDALVCARAEAHDEAGGSCGVGTRGAVGLAARLDDVIAIAPAKPRVRNFNAARTLSPAPGAPGALSDIDDESVPITRCAHLGERGDTRLRRHRSPRLGCVTTGTHITRCCQQSQPNVQS